MPISKEEAREHIADLVKKYERIKAEGRIKRYNEEMTKKDFIVPLFGALGWDVYNKKADEVTAEEKVSKGRVDYAIRINGMPKLFVEAKALRGDLDQPRWAKQAINYAWHKGVIWAVLTDFEEVKVFNAEIKSTYPLQSLLFSLSYRQYLDQFDQLWLLSRESLEQGLLDKKAEKWGKKLRKAPVDKQLLADFTRWRELLSKDILKLNLGKDLTEEDLDESVQRILDRLIFIRSCEDRGLEQKALISDMREWGDRGRGALVKKVREIFRDFDDKYNSELFREHLCDDLEISNEVLKDVISGLDRTQDMTIAYDFSAIDADVLGTIYEQYLGHLLKKTPKRAKLEAKKAHRKEHGIYYTPTYIVDYIVRNTLGELLKDKKVDAENIKILDPACGSGSFLIKSFDVMNEYWAKKDKDYAQTELDAETGTPFTRKVKILKNNVFGVDLDAKAVEIAQLNLLLKVAEKRHKLPLLRQNIKCGNSLIDDPAVAGDKAFKWEEEFEQIMDGGGFDVVIGNPPYIPIEVFSTKDKSYYFSRYESPYRKFDTAILFIEKGISLLREGGLIGFIVPLTWQTGDNYARFRDTIFSKCTLKCVINLPFDVFPDAYVDTGIIVLRKGKPKKSKFIAYSYDKKAKIHGIEDLEFQTIEQEHIENEPEKKVFTNKFIYTILEKLNKNSVPLGEITDSCQGVVISKFPVAESKLNESYKKLLTKGTGNRYTFELEETKYIDYGKVMDLYKYYSQPRIFVRRIINRQNRLMAFYYESPLITKKDYNPFIVIDKKYNIKYILGLMNSKLFSHLYIYSSALALKDDFRQTTLSGLRKLPIKKASEKEQKNIAELVDKITELNRQLLQFKNKKTDERAKIEEKIKKIDAKIDEWVYKLYGITEKEKKIIEESLR